MQKRLPGDAHLTIVQIFFLADSERVTTRMFESTQDNRVVVQDKIVGHVVIMHLIGDFGRKSL